MLQKKGENSCRCRNSLWETLKESCPLQFGNKQRQTQEKGQRRSKWQLYYAQVCEKTLPDSLPNLLAPKNSGLSCERKKEKKRLHPLGRRYSIYQSKRLNYIYIVLLKKNKNKKTHQSDKSYLLPWEAVRNRTKRIQEDYTTEVPPQKQEESPQQDTEVRMSP